MPVAGAQAYTNSVLESAFRQSIRWKMLVEDLCAGVDLPRVRRKEMEALSVGECRRFLDTAEKSEWFPVLALALTTGMHPSEYLALKWTDINWQRGTASVCRTIQVIGSEAFPRLFLRLQGPFLFLSGLLACSKYSNAMEVYSSIRTIQREGKHIAVASER